MSILRWASVRERECRRGSAQRVLGEHRRRADQRGDGQHAQDAGGAHPDLQQQAAEHRASPCPMP